ncbi:MAG: hypothetical protein IJJ01_05645 [Firmicutes bacterium]|nr:hypothetical protein [Bacillota bacterium]
MKFRNTVLSKRTIALFAVSLLLLVSGGAVGTKAAITVTSDNYDATIATDSLAVGITENGKTVDDGVLYKSIGNKIEPTRTYKDSVGVVNNGDADEYVRVIVRKYWTDKEGAKATTLSPDLIELTADKSWTVKEGGSEETQIYYLKNILKAGAEQELFKDIRISGDVLEEGKGKIVEGVQEGKATKTIITYTYKYNGYTFNVEAEAQAVQTHNAAKAIKSVWGVDAGSVGIDL